MADDDAPKPRNEPPPAPIPGRYTGPTALAPSPMSRLAPAFQLVDLAAEIQKADEQIATVTSGKLTLLAEQIRNLQAKAKEVLERAKRDADLHRASCRFEKKPGGIYHLYRETDGRLWFSLIAKDEWRTGAPDYVGSYRLETDMSFTPLEELEGRDAQEESLRKLLLPNV